MNNEENFSEFADEGDLKVVENFLDDTDFQKIYEYSQKIKCWEIQSSTTGFGYEFLRHDVIEDKYYSEYLFNHIKKFLKEDYQISQIYFNGQWSTREGTLHKDMTKKTVLIYIGKYEFGWRGFTEIVMRDDTQIIVPPIQNRMICFSGDLFHKGYSFSYQHCPMRISLVYRLI